MRILVFTNLWPSSVAPTHGCFVRDRLERLRGRMGLEMQVVHPVPLYPPMPGGSLAARHSRLPARERVDGVDVHYPRYFHVPRYGTARQAQRVVRGARKTVQRLVAEFKPCLVDAHYVYPDGLAAIRLAREAGLPCLVTARGSDVTQLPDDAGVRAQVRELLPKATRALAVSRDLAATMAEIAGMPAGEIVVVPNGVDLERFRPGGGTEQRLVTVAQLIPRKRIELLIEALAEPAGSELPELVVVGDGPERSRLEALAAAKQVARRVHFRGALGRDDAAAELQRGGVFVFPTRLEGCPNAVLEALACGLPVVATAVNGIPDILGSSDSGVLLPVTADASGWAAALSQAAARYRDEPAAWSASARRRAEELGWDRTLDVLEDVFEEARR